jgi:hypothetical protein
MKNKIKQVLMILLVISTILIVGCGKKVFTQEAVIDCEEGKYSLNNEMKKKADNMNMKISHVLVEKTSYGCDATMILDKPMVMFGTEIFFMPVGSCSTVCVDNGKQRNLSYDDIAYYCCE